MLRARVTLSVTSVPFTICNGPLVDSAPLVLQKLIFLQEGNKALDDLLRAPLNHVLSKVHILAGQHKQISYLRAFSNLT